MRLLAALLLLAAPALAEPDHRAAAQRALDEVIRPSTAGFAEAAERLAEAAPAHCADVDRAGLDAAFQTAWDAWMGLQHLRFGPIEEADRGLQVAFWPDSRGTVGRTVARLMATESAPVDDPAAFAKLSVGGRGFPALERLLFDDQGPRALTVPYHCAYVAATAGDILRLATEIDTAWAGPWRSLWLSAGDAQNTVFLAPEETSQRLFAVTLGALEQTSRNRLGKPLGSLTQPRPRLAEAWRSGRSLRQIALVLDATEATVIAAFAPALSGEEMADIAAAYARARRDLGRVVELGGLGEALAANRIRVEVLQQSVDRVAQTITAAVGPALGIATGFNSADGD